jgi:carbamoyl-phosphate synthase large subunit
MNRNKAIPILVAGIAGASLGTEVAKSLRAVGDYRVLGCDINPFAYGHFDDSFDATFVSDPDDYIESVLAIAVAQEVRAIVPGGEVPAKLLAAATEKFKAAGIAIAQNEPEVVRIAGDKGACFERLTNLGIPIPVTRSIEHVAELHDFPMPCIIKPSKDSGGSSFVFFARTLDEAAVYVTYLRQNGLLPIAQAYIPEENGEYTVGVLSDLNGQTLGVIALRRLFNAKLSVMTRGKDFLISSGYSQGKIDVFPEVCASARRIAEAIGSRGPMNVQGRVDIQGRFIPFEINPRFSASTHLRTLAGFNEVDHFLRHILGLKPRAALEIRPGFYLRSLNEISVGQPSPALSK